MNEESPRPAEPAPTAGLAPWRRVVLVACEWTLMVFLVAGLVQIFLAGLGVFDLDGQRLGEPGETAFEPHRVLGFAMGGLSVLILVLALLSRPTMRFVVISAVLFLLSFVAQSVLADVGENSGFFGGLHALDGLAILAIAGVLHAMARRGVRATASPVATRTRL